MIKKENRRKIKMEYLKEFGVKNEQIMELKERYNEGIIKFLTNEEIFVRQALEYLQEKNFLIYPILENNIKIFLETTITLKNKVRRMEEKGYSNKTIQMILINEDLYNKQ